MKAIALVWVASMLSCFTAMSQENTADDPFGTPPSTKFTILLGPDFKPEESPFLDAFTFYEHLKKTHPIPNLQLKDITIDIETPLPTEPGPSLQVRVPELKPDQTMDQIRKEYLSKTALPFGITRVEVQVDKALKEPVSTIRIGMVNLPSVDWNKYLTIAEMLSSDRRIEIYDETPFFDPYRRISMMGGAGMGGGMGGMGGGMGGMGMSGSSLMGAMDGMAATRSTWAEPTGLIEGNGLLISWSLKNQIVAAINAESSTDWQRIEVDGDAITSPVVGLDMCLFLTRDTAYGFSKSANVWSKHAINWNGETPPSISIRNQFAQVISDDEVLVFTASGQWFTRNGSVSKDQTSDVGLSVTPQAMASPSMMSGLGAATMGDDYSTSSPTAEDLQLTIDLLRASLDGLNKKSDELKSGYQSATDEVKQKSLRDELTQVAHRLITSEIKLQQAEVQLIESKLQRVNSQIAERDARRDELADEQVKQWLGEAKQP